MEIVSKAYPDHTAFDPSEKYFDSKSDPENPRWLMVDVRYIRHLDRMITLGELRQQKQIADMKLLPKRQQTFCLASFKDGVAIYTGDGVRH